MVLVLPRSGGNNNNIKTYSNVRAARICSRCYWEPRSRNHLLHPGRPEMVLEQSLKAWVRVLHADEGGWAFQAKKTGTDAWGRGRAEPILGPTERPVAGVQAVRGKVAVNSWEEEKVVGVVCGRRDVLGCYASYFVKEEGMNRGRMSKDT